MKLDYPVLFQIASNTEATFVNERRQLLECSFQRNCKDLELNGMREFLGKLLAPRVRCRKMQIIFVGDQGMDLKIKPRYVQK